MWNVLVFLFCNESEYTMHTGAESQSYTTNRYSLACTLCICTSVWSLITTDSSHGSNLYVSLLSVVIIFSAKHLTYLLTVTIRNWCVVVAVSSPFLPSRKFHASAVRPSSADDITNKAAEAIAEPVSGMLDTLTQTVAGECHVFCLCSKNSVCLFLHKR